MMTFLDCTLPTIEENLALDEALLLAAEAGGTEVLRVWRWPRSAVVLGAGGRLTDEVDELCCLADRVPIQRRSSGGGSVLLGEGCLLYSLVLAFERHPALADLHASFSFILDRILTALEPHVGPVSRRGISDLALGNLKFSGNAQQRKRTHLLHHGTILHAFDASLVERYLKLPPRQPDYRRGRGHLDFLTNLPVAEETLTGLLRDAWQTDQVMTELPREMVRMLVEKKYRLDAWIRRR